MPLDMLITGRIATLAGDTGFGWVEAVGIRDGRIAFAGSEVALETRARPAHRAHHPHSRRGGHPGHHRCPPPSRAGRVRRPPGRPDRRGDPRRRARRDRAPPIARRSDPDAWLEGHGWDSDRWGRWPTAADLETVAPGRRCALWAHDHHALLASRAALATAGVDVTTPDPAGGIIRRDPDGEPEGVLYEAATGLVSVHVPVAGQADLERAVVNVSQDLLLLGVVAVQDPGGLAPDPHLRWAYPAYAHLSDTGRLPIRLLASLRADALDTAIERGLHSGSPIGEDSSGRARVGWQKCFADGSLGSRTAALLEDIEPEPDRPLPPDRRRGVWVTPPEELDDSRGGLPPASIATQIHAIGDAAVRAALDVLEPDRRERPVHASAGARPAARSRRPRHASRRAASPRASNPPISGTDAAQARLLWGDRAERSGYTWASIARTGAVMPFGTDAPVESFDPWPGIALAVRREDPRWSPGTPVFAPGQSLSIGAGAAVCVRRPASLRERAGSRPAHGRPACRSHRHPGRRDR